MSNSDSQWERFGREDPYFGVLTAENYKRENLTDVGIDEFFASGKNHIDAVYQMIQQHFDAHFNPTECLDFGCGVGRLIVPMARRFPHVVGIDVSKSMLTEAAKNCERYGINNVSLIQSDDELKNVNQTFDLIHSTIVFQHISTARGYKVFEQLVRRLNSGGVAAIHFTYTWNTSSLRKSIHWAQKNVPLVHRLINIAKHRPINYPRMDMNSYDLNHLNYLLQIWGFNEIYMQYTDSAGYFGVTLFFRRS